METERLTNAAQLYEILVKVEYYWKMRNDESNHPRIWICLWARYERTSVAY